jgi:hypothetical protein
MATVVALALLPHRTGAAEYTFTRVAISNATGGLGLSVPSINDSGTVAFVNTASPGFGLYTGNGGPLTTITTGAHFGFYFAGSSSIYPSLNNAGRTVFYSAPPVLSGNPDGILAGSGGPLTTIVTEPGPMGSGGFNQMPSIADDGTVVFTVTHVGGLPGAGVFVGSGGAITTLLSSPTYTGALVDPAISNGGTIAYEWPILVGPANVGQTLTVYKNGITTPVASVNGFFSSLDVNDAGMVVSSIHSGSGAGIYKGDENGFGRTIGPTANGYSLFGTASINDLNGIAFEGIGATFSGIYTGSDPIADKVVAVGYALDGSTIFALAMGRDALNDAGQIAFWAKLTDGRQGVYIATAVPEPASLAILAIGSMMLTLRRCRGTN